MIPILFLSQALNAVLLHALGRGDRIATGLALAVIAISVLALGVLTVL